MLRSDRPPRPLLALRIFACLFLPLAAADITNRTIDDSLGDAQTGARPTYAPATGIWRDQTCPPCATCTTPKFTCAISPDTAQAFDGTYTAATYTPQVGAMNITLQFQGTAIYVFFILVNNAGAGVVSQTTANFTLDGDPPRLLEQRPNMATADIDYNQLVFAQTGLENTQHTLVISTSGGAKAYVNFDYAIYTHDDADASSAPVPAGNGNVSSTTTASRTPSSSPSTGADTPTALSLSLAQSAAPTPPASGPAKTQNAPTTNRRALPGLVAGCVGGAAAAVLALGAYLARRMRTGGSPAHSVAPRSGPASAGFGDPDEIGDGGIPAVGAAPGGPPPRYSPVLV